MYRLVESMGLPLTTCERRNRDLYPALSRTTNARLIYNDATVLKDYVRCNSVSRAALMSGLRLVEDLEGLTLAFLSCLVLRATERSLSA